MRLDRFAQEVASKLQLKLFMSNRYVYAQIVRHSDGNVVASASTIESALRQGLPGSGVDKGACAKYVLLFYLLFYLLPLISIKKKKQRTIRLLVGLGTCWLSGHWLLEFKVSNGREKSDNDITGELLPC